MFRAPAELAASVCLAQVERHQLAAAADPRLFAAHDDGVGLVPQPARQVGAGARGGEAFEHDPISAASFSTSTRGLTR